MRASTVETYMFERTSFCGMLRHKVEGQGYNEMIDTENKPSPPSFKTPIEVKEFFSIFCWI